MDPSSTTVIHRSADGNEKDDQDKKRHSSIHKRDSRVSGIVRQVSHWSTQFRGEGDEDLPRPPSGHRYQRTSSTVTTDKPYHSQTSRQSSVFKRSVSSTSQTKNISPAAYHNDLKQDIKPGLNSNLVLAAIVVVFGSSFQFGFNIGVLNPQAMSIRAFYGDVYNITREGDISPSGITVLWSLTTALFIPGGLIGSLLGGWTADRFGRKYTLILSHIFILIGAPLASACVAAQSPEMLMISRIFFGLNAGLGNCAAPMFLSEITPFSIRGAFSTVHQLFITIGILMSSIFGLPQILGSDMYWQYLFLLELIPAITALVAIPFLHETPRFLLLIRRERNQAQDALVFYRKTDDVSAEMEEMDTEHSSSTETKSFSWKQLLTMPDLRRPLLIAAMLQVMQQFSGINAIFFYSAGIFEKAGVPLEHIPYAILGTNVVNVMMTVITVPIIDKVGRRPLLMIPMLIMAGDLILLTICLKLQPMYPPLGIVSVISIIIYVIGFAVGLGPIPWMLAAELFRQGPRPKAMSLAGIVNWIGTFIIAMAFEPLQEAVGDFTFLIFCVLLLIFTAFTFLCVPETKNLTFEEIANKFSPGKAIEVEMVDDDADGNVQLEQFSQLQNPAVVNFDLSPPTPSMIEKPKLSPNEDLELKEINTFDTKF